MSAAAVVIIINTRPRAPSGDDNIEVTLDFGYTPTHAQKVAALTAALAQLNASED